MEKTHVFAAMLAALMLCGAPLARAQQPAEADIALVRDLLRASGAEKQYESIMAIMAQNVQEGVKQGVRQGMDGALRDKTVDPATREQAQAIVERHLQEILRDYDGEIRRVMPFDKLVDEVYAPIYFRYFTRADLAEVIAFFKTPVGRKFAESSPGLMQESSQVVNQRYMPQLMQFMGRQMDQHMKGMAEELNKL